MNLTQRLLAGSLAVISVFVVLAVLIVDRRVDQRSTEETIRQLTREARLIVALADENTNHDSLARAAAGVSGRRISIIGPNGVLLGDSEIAPNALSRVENQRSKPDVAAAIDSGKSSFAEYEFAGRSLLHVSVPYNGNAVRLSVPSALPGTLTRAIQRDLLLAGLTAFAFALALALLFARSISRPVIELRDVARALAAGDLTRRPAISAPGEVGELSRALYSLSGQLASRIGALQDEDVFLSALIDSLHEGVIAVDSHRSVVRINAAGRKLLHLNLATPFSTDLLPRHRLLREALAEALAGRATGEIELAVEDRSVALAARPLSAGGAVLALFDLTPIRQLEVVRRDFVANASHELKTPLTIIGGFAETLAAEDVPREQRREFARLILSNAVRMQRLVDDLLDLSRIESGGWRPAPSRIALKAAVDECLSLIEPQAVAKGLTVTFEQSPEATEIFADPTALRQMLLNLLGNALRFTHEGGITVEASLVPGGVRLAVTDTGVGIPPEHLPRIFERFYRVDSGRARDLGGTGLGLAIVRHMAEAHGGQVSASSKAGTGTTVAVVLPAAARTPSSQT